MFGSTKTARRHATRTRLAACVTLLALASTACSVGAKRKKDADDSKVTAAEILIDPKFDLNFAPSINQPLFIQFTMRNVRSAEEKFEFRAKNSRNEDISAEPALFGAPIRKVTQDGVLYTVVVSVPFVLNDKTVGGFKATVSLPGYTDGEGKPMTRETQFSLRQGAYPQDHFAQESAVADFAVANEFLLPVERADLDVASYIEAVLNAPALGSAQETDRNRLRNRVSIVTEGSEKVIILKGNVAFSYSTPGTGRIRTNGNRVVFLGGDWSKVTVEAGVQANTRRAGNAAAPEIAIYALKPPRIVNQMLTDDPEGPYPAARGPRGAAADVNRCNVLVGKLTQTVEGFPGDRASCKDDLRALGGEDQTLTLSFRRYETDIPVTPDDGQSLASLVALTKADGSSIFTDLGARPCVFDDANQSRDTCVFTNYTRALTPRDDLNADGGLAAYIQTYHAPKILPFDHDSGGYAGEGSVVATRGARTNPNERLTGTITAKPNMSALDGKIFGWAGYWREGGAAYNAIANRCFETLRGAASTQDAAIPGATPDRSTLVAADRDTDKAREVTFASRFPGLTLLDGVSFQTKIGDAREDARGGALEISAGDTGEFVGLDGKKVFRLKESYRNRLRPLAAKLTVLGEPGLDGYDAPATRAVFPTAVDEKAFLDSYALLAGPAGLPGLALGFPNSTERVFSPGTWKVILKDGSATTPAPDIDAALAANYGVTVVRDEKGRPTGLTYFPVQAKLARGNEISYSFTPSEMQAQAKAPFEIYTHVTGTLTLDAVPNLELQPSVTNPGAGGVSGAGAVRVGVENAATSPLSGFFGFGQGSLPFLFKNCGLCSGYIPSDGEGGSASDGGGSGSADGGGGTSGGGSADGGSGSEGGGGSSKSYTERAYSAIKEFFSGPNTPHNKGLAGKDDADMRSRRAEAVIPISGRFLAETAEWDCKASGAFSSLVLRNVLGTPTVDMSKSSWRARGVKHMWVNDGNYPACGSVNGAFLQPQRCKRTERRPGPDEVFSEQGRNWHKWPGSWDAYMSEVRDACLASADVAAAAKNQDKDNARHNFLITNCPKDDGCNTARSAAEKLTALFGKATGSQGTIVDGDVYSPKTISDMKSFLGQMINGQNAVDRVMKASYSNGSAPEIAWIGDRIFTISEGIKAATAKIAQIEAASRPGISGGALPQCSYEISGGRFRSYGRASLISPLSAYGGLAKQTNLKTSLVKDYSYPKYGAPSVTDVIQTPDVSPLMSGEKLVLRDPDTAKVGAPNGLTRGIAQDCADIANLARREKIPLPRKMFTSEMCKPTSVAKR